MQIDNTVATHCIGVVKHNRVVSFLCIGMAKHGETVAAYDNSCVVSGFV